MPADYDSLKLDVQIERQPGIVVVTGAVFRPDGSLVPVDWPIVIVGGPEPFTDEMVLRDVAGHAEGLG